MSDFCLKRKNGQYMIHSHSCNNQYIICYKLIITCHAVMNILTLGSDCYKVLFNPLPDLSDKMDRYAIYRLSSKAQTSLFKLMQL